MHVLSAVLLALLAVGLPAAAHAERLPIRTYTTADGLAHNLVSRIVADSRGFLWFCTREGLSRFDGYAFTTYGVEQGLPSASVHDLLETADGTYWIATAAGVVRLNPLGLPGPLTDQGALSDHAMFAAFFPGEGARARHVNALAEDPTGAIWVGTRGGLYRLDAGAGAGTAPSFVDLGIADHLDAREINVLMVDASGALWIGGSGGLYRRRPDGHVERYAMRDGLSDTYIQALLADGGDGLWVGTRSGGLCRLSLDPSGRAAVVRTYGLREGLPATWISSIVHAADGGLWVGTSRGLTRLSPATGAMLETVATYGAEHGLPHQEVLAIAHDRHQNLWIGSAVAGVGRMPPSGVTMFGEDDRLAWANSLTETSSGTMLVVGGPIGRWFVHRFAGRQFEPVTLPIALDQSSWGWNQTVLVDRTGAWWIASRRGVLRFDNLESPEALARARPSATYTTRDGLASNVVLRLFEDSHGDVWIGTVGEGRARHGLSRWERKTGALHHAAEGEGLPPLDRHYVSAFAEDRGGHVWIGFSGSGGLVRHRSGRFERVEINRGAPAVGSIRNVLIDSRGRLWAASYNGGLLRVDNAAEARPAVSRYTTAAGLSSNDVHAVAEDRWGRIYAATGRALDRLTPETGRITRYAAAQGLPVTEWAAALRDRDGALWFSHYTGVVRLVPEPDPPPLPPPILITAVRLNEEPHAISALGETVVPPVERLAHRTRVQVDFASVGFGPQAGIRYQVKLEGADEDWSQPSDLRTIHYASLGSGRYHFLVRAVTAEGTSSEAPAGFRFGILPPVYQRWWFVSLVAVALAAAVYTLARYRMWRRLELAEIRARIATDLHDDIGANLTRIAVLSEAARQRAHDDASHADGSPSSIATVARESVTAMSDIVWAISPERDGVEDLGRKMRAHAEDTFAVRDVGLTFNAPGADRPGTLTMDVRRDLFLIFKEAVNNAARHAGCTHARIDLHASGPSLVLVVADDGVGFDTAAETDGNGLISMRRRAARLAATLEIGSRRGAGTTIRVVVPLARPHRWHAPTFIDR